MELLERQPQLGALHEYVAQARAGEGRLVLIGGEAGVGKSSLVEQLETEVPSTMPWYAGACDGLFTPRALGPLRDIAVQAGGELARLVNGHASRGDLFSAVLEQLRGFGSGPAGAGVVSIEDIHWADEATLDLLRYLGRRLRAAPVLVLVTYRDDEVQGNDPLRITLGELSTQRSTRRIDLPPLSAAAVAELAQRVGLEGDAVYRLTGGNPFFVTETLAFDGRAFEERALGGMDVAPSARDAVLSRVGRLDERGRECAWTAALMGARVEAELLDAATEGLSDALDGLVAHGLLVGGDTDLRFRHELSRLAVEQDVPPHRRRDVHTRLLAVLEARQESDVARLAHHAEGAGDAEAVLRHGAQAGAQAARLGAHREAALQYARATRFSGDADPSVAAELYDKLAVEQSLADAWQEAAHSSQTARELWRQQGDVRREGLTLAFLARVMWRLCRPEEQEYAAEAVALLEPLGSSPELARALSQLALSRRNAGDQPAAQALAERARELADRLGLEDVVAESLITRGISTRSPDDLRQALQVAMAAEAHEQAGSAYGFLQTSMSKSWDFPAAERWYREGTRYCDDHDITTWASCLRAHHAAAVLAQGRLREAQDLSRRVLGVRVISPENRMAPLVTLGLALARAGAHEEAAGHLEEAVANAVQSGLPGWNLEALVPRAEARWLRGDDDGARADIERVGPARDAYGAVDAGEVEGWARRLGLPPAGPPRSFPEPYELLLAGEPMAAAESFEAWGCPYEAGLAWYDAGDEPGLRLALERFDELGATATALRARQALRDLGVRGIPTGARAVTRAHPAGLTPREAEVLDHLADGLTNEQIASVLVISPRTVDHHVSSLLAKLGAKTRGEAAAHARRLGVDA
jgi:DNA-binding CsgD family transcriptional regulator/tetratricopeptide (TPR) repeat protein